SKEIEMKFAGVLLFPLFMGLMQIQGGNVGAEGVRGKEYDTYYLFSGIGCDLYFKNGYFGSTARGIAGGTWIELDLIVISWWQVTHDDGAKTQGYSFNGGAFIYGVYTKPGSPSQAMIGTNNPNGCADAQASSRVLPGVSH